MLAGIALLLWGGADQEGMSETGGGADTSESYKAE